MGVWSVELYNTLTRRKQPFEPVDDPISMYVCGITPYDDAHLGHAMSIIIFDTLRRFLEWRGRRVRLVYNFTDVDDKLIARAAQEGITVSELAERQIASFMGEWRELGIAPADVHPRATEEIPQMIDLIDGLIEKGMAYPAGGDVYYRVREMPGYGKLSGRSLEDMISAEPTDIGVDKEHAMDFTLWKGAKPGEPQWESPWGPGRPGWHIECSAMSIRYLGEQIDLHGGGMDLIFPHHENEIAQSEGFLGTGSVRASLDAQRDDAGRRREDVEVDGEDRGAARGTGSIWRGRAADVRAGRALSVAVDVLRGVAVVGGAGRGALTDGGDVAAGRRRR